MNWLEQLLMEFARNPPCTDGCCTTCGGNGLRTKLAVVAAREAGVTFPEEARLSGMPLPDDLDGDDRRKCAEAIAAALSELPVELAFTPAAKMIEMVEWEMNASFSAWRGEIEARLNTWKRRVEARREEIDPEYRRHREAIREAERENARRRKEEREEHERLNAIRRQEEEVKRQEEKRQRREENAEEVQRAHRKRIQDKKERDEKRAALLQKLTDLPAMERLRRVLGSDPEFPLDAIPPEMFSLSADDLANLDASTMRGVIQIIGRRPGGWARLKSELLKQLTELDERTGDQGDIRASERGIVES